MLNLVVAGVVLVLNVILQVYGTIWFPGTGFTRNNEPQGFHLKVERKSANSWKLCDFLDTNRYRLDSGSCTVCGYVGGVVNPEYIKFGTGCCRNGLICEPCAFHLSPEVDTRSFDEMALKLPPKQTVCSSCQVPIGSRLEVRLSGLQFICSKACHNELPMCNIIRMSRSFFMESLRLGSLLNDMFIYAQCYCGVKFFLKRRAAYKARVKTLPLWEREMSDIMDLFNEMGKLVLLLNSFLEGKKYYFCPLFNIWGARECSALYYHGLHPIVLAQQAHLDMREFEKYCLPVRLHYHEYCDKIDEIVDRFVGRLEIPKNLVRGPRDIFDLLGPVRASPSDFLLY